MNEYFEEVKIIPKPEKGKKRDSKYDKLYEALKSTAIGYKGKIKIDRKDISNYYAALIARDKTSKNLKLIIRNAKREKNGNKAPRLVEGDLYFERMSEGTARSTRSRKKKE